MKKIIITTGLLTYSSFVFCADVTCDTTLYFCSDNTGDNVIINTTATGTTSPLGGWGIYLGNKKYYLNDITINTSGDKADAIRTNGNSGDFLFSTGLINIKTTGPGADGINIGVVNSSNVVTATVILSGDNGYIEAEAVGVRANNHVTSGSKSIIILGNNYTINQTGASANNYIDSSGYAVYAGNRDYDSATSSWSPKDQFGSSYVFIGDNANITLAASSGAAVYANKGGIIQLGNNVSISAPNDSYYLYSSTEAQNTGFLGESKGTYRPGTILLKGDVTFTDVSSLDQVVMMSTGADSIIKSGYVDYSYNTSDGSDVVIGNDIIDSSGKYTIDGGLNALKGGEISLSMSDGSSFNGFTAIDDNVDSTLNLVIDGNTSYWDLYKDSSLTELTLKNGASLLAYDTNNSGAANYTIIATSVSNGGVINLSAGTAGDKLTIKGNYISNGGVLKLDTELGDDTSTTDMLIVDGNITTGTGGSTKVVVENAGGQGAQTVEGLKIVSVLNGTSSDDAFVKSERIVAGAYDYDLVKGNTSKTDTEGWYLTSYLTPDTPNVTPEHMIRPEAGSYLSNLFAANTMFNLRLHDRLGETQYTDLLTGEKKVTSMWLRYQYSHNKFEADNGQLDVKSNANITQLGGDIAQWSSNGLNRLHIGLMAGYGRSTNDTDSKITNYSAKGTIDGYSLGVYGTWYDNNEDKTGLYVDSWLLWNDFSASVKGEDLAKEKYDLSGLTASVESGYTFLAKDYENHSIWLQPKGQLTWMGVSADNHTESNGTKVKGEGKNVQVRLGGRATIGTNENYNLSNNKLSQIFVEANWIYNTQPFEVKLDDVKVKQEGARNIGEIKLGAEGDFYKNTTLWANAAYQAGNNSYENIIFMVGGKYSF